MDSKGHNQIRSALDEIDVDVTIVPRPEQGQDVRYLTVETPGISYPPATILNGLARAGLMEGGNTLTTLPGYPLLHVIGLEDGSITFEDVNSRNIY